MAPVAIGTPRLAAMVDRGAQQLLCCLVAPVVRLAEFPRSVSAGSWVTRQGDRRERHRGFASPSELVQEEKVGWDQRDSWERQCRPETCLLWGRSQASLHPCGRMQHLSSPISLGDHGGLILSAWIFKTQSRHTALFKSHSNAGVEFRFIWCRQSRWALWLGRDTENLRTTEEYAPLIEQHEADCILSYEQMAQALAGSVTCGPVPPPSSRCPMVTVVTVPRGLNAPSWVSPLRIQS